MARLPPHRTQVCNDGSLLVTPLDSKGYKEIGTHKRTLVQLLAMSLNYIECDDLNELIYDQIRGLLDENDRPRTT